MANWISPDVELIENIFELTGELEHVTVTGNKEYVTFEFKSSSLSSACT
jgi:hypothetical protein